MKQSSDKIIRGLLAIMLTLVVSFGYAQSVSQDFDDNDINVLEASCWESTDFTLTDSDSINSGASAPMGVADIESDYLDSASLTSPYIYFDATGTVTFTHKMSAHNGSEVSAGLEVEIIDPAGNSTTILTHSYKSFGVISPPAATVVRMESINVSWTGYYRIKWSWVSEGNRDTITNTGYGNAYIDDISIGGSFAAESSNEFNGYCPGLFYLKDTVCAGEEDASYTPLGANATGHTYSWSFTGTSGGTIDNSVTASNEQIEVDWNWVSGNYQLLSQESAIGSYKGNKTYYDVYVRQAPSMVSIIQNDTVCDGSVVSVVFTLSGTAPFEITFVDELGTHTVTASTTTYTYTPSAHMDNIEVISVEDAYGCLAEEDDLLSLWLYYFVNPSTGLIVRY